jgi:hypothetical protein
MSTERPQTIFVPYTLHRDEDGSWSAHAWLGSSGGANGDGVTPDQAVADLREAVLMVIREDGVPPELKHHLTVELG